MGRMASYSASSTAKGTQLRVIFTYTCHMQAYGQRGFVLRFIHSKGDARKFEELDTGIHHAMEVGFLLQPGVFLRKGGR
eukprot:scaffold220804_cov19-Tisochrysis_lutea.AAC.1